ncbi:MAG: gamma carbonic anhydrase family protein [Eubacteriaceae bacterium]|jgi:carbonic anhydrase/acetyltransferase-like protein (isoleucine patch superfamily)|nr:gamma carbonic anhydrase family protein [Eubacteriaceae bacterium]
MSNTHRFIAPSADVLGKVKLGKNASIWFQAVVRGDLNEIVIGENSNVQDGTIIHVMDHLPTHIGNNVTIGHNCILHGCTLEDYVYIGMGAIVMNGATIGHHTIIGAGALITENTVIPPYSVAVGSPAKVIKSVSEEQILDIEENAKQYVAFSKQYPGKSFDLDQDGYLIL